MVGDIRLGDRVRFRREHVPLERKGREDAVGVVIETVSPGGPWPWLVVKFEGYESGQLQPGLVDLVERAPARDDPEMAN